MIFVFIGMLIFGLGHAIARNYEVIS